LNPKWELQKLLGNKMEGNVAGDFYHKKGITTDKVKQQINAVRVQFGMKIK
jgi:hypothetical protein